MRISVDKSDYAYSDIWCQAVKQIRFNGEFDPLNYWTTVDTDLGIGVRYLRTEDGNFSTSDDGESRFLETEEVAGSFELIMNDKFPADLLAHTLAAQVKP